MKKILFLILVSTFAFGADQIIGDATSGNRQFVDNSGTRWNAGVAYTTNGNGDVYTLGGLSASTDNIIGDMNSGSHLLIDNSGNRWGLQVFYTTDGNGNAVPISFGTPGAATWGLITGSLSSQTDLQTALNAKQNSLGFTPLNRASNLSDLVSASTARTNLGLGSAATQPSSAFDASGAAAAAQLAAIGGIPLGVIPTMGNKIQYDLSKDGLLIQSFNTPAFTSGAFNGGGTGSKAVLGFNNYNNLAFSGLTALSFTARSVRDEFSVPGNVYWNNLANFNSGALTLANDYVNLVADGMTAQKYYVLTGSHSAYPINMTTSRAWKAVGGTGALIMNGDCTSGSNVITNISNVNALTAGMYFRVTFNSGGPDTTCVPDGSTIVSINTGANSAVISNNATATAATQSFRQYGGIPPVSRSGISSGSTTITGISNTADLQVNMLVDDSSVLVPAHSYIVSMVANTSITLNNAVALGTPTLNFLAAGKTGLPGNGEPMIGIPWSRVVSNNPNGYFANTAPTVAGGWAAADGGWPKNAVQGAFNFIMGGSGTLDSRIVALKSVTINSDTYTFAQ